MGSPLSVGDAMLLGSLAWKIGCAFTSGRSGAPAEFREVENELRSLQDSLSSLEDTLGDDGSILSRADDRTKKGLRVIISSCWEVSVHSIATARLKELMPVIDSTESRDSCQPVSRVTEKKWRLSARCSPRLEKERDSQLQDAIMDNRGRENSGSSEYVATTCRVDKYHGDSSPKVPSCWHYVERRTIT